MFSQLNFFLFIFFLVGPLRRLFKLGATQEQSRPICVPLSSLSLSVSRCMEFKRRMGSVLLSLFWESRSVPVYNIKIIPHLTKYLLNPPQNYLFGKQNSQFIFFCARVCIEYVQYQFLHETMQFFFW